MTKTVLVLGAGGRFGRAASHAFVGAGWDVIAATRKGKGPQIAGLRHVACDVMDRAAVCAAARGVDVIVHAINPLYPEWAELLPVQTANIIAAGLESGATVMISGNVYPFGPDAGEVWREGAAVNPPSRKGALRVQMEHSFAVAAADGLRTIILRGGDFMERAQTGSWFETYLANKSHKGVFTYPGRMDAVHAWAYLPDMGRAMAMLADKRAELPPFSAFGFEGYSITGAELMAAVGKAIGKPQRAKKFPWPILKLMARFNPLMHEVLEMRYLWDTPHRLDGSALRSLLPDFVPTPLDVALRDILECDLEVAANRDALMLTSA